MIPISELQEYSDWQVTFIFEFNDNTNAHDHGLIVGIL